MLAGIGLDVGSRRLQEIYRPSTRIGHDVVEVEVQSRGLEEHSRRASLFPPRITRNDCRRRSRSRRLAASDVNSPADEKAAYKPSGNTLRLALGPQVSSSTHATPGTERWEKKARFTSCTNDLCIVFSERRMFGGTTAIAESFPKPDDKAGCRTNARSFHWPVPRSGSFSSREFPLRQPHVLPVSAACPSRRRWPGTLR